MPLVSAGRRLLYSRSMMESQSQESHLATPLSIDVSIILNLHDEARYLGRTLASIQEAVSYAQAEGLAIELVVVLDNATQATRECAVTADLSSIDAVQFIELNHGSLGPARNAGIDVARGRYVTTADGDDLVSFNFFSSMFYEAENHPGTIIVPEFLYGFGSRYHLWQYFGTDRVSKLAFVGLHPFCSRIFFPRNLADAVRYTDTTATRFFAYEDWHFNCQAVAAGYEFRAAPNTILFYRQRANSIMTREGHDKLSPYSEMFSAKTYLERLAADMQAYRKRRQAPKYSPEGTRLYCMNSKVMLELLYAANRIEAAIDLEHVKHMHIGSNMGWGYQRAINLGAALYECLHLLNDVTYDDVFLLPFLSKGGAEKYMLEIMRSMIAAGVSRRVLIVAGEKFKEHHGVDALPPQVDFLDVRTIADQHDIENISVLLLRLIQSTAPKARLHTNGAEFASSFLQNYYRALPHNPIAYYYFCAATISHEHLDFKYGNAMNFISEALPGMRWIISDHQRILDDLNRKVWLQPTRTEVLYAPIEVRDAPSVAPQRSPHSGPLRLLWASRIDTQKRPDLVPRIAQRLEKSGIAVTIDMYGGSVFGYPLPGGVGPNESVRYLGTFENFQSLPYKEYDLFLYTSCYDGLPNVVLEALSCGMLVIAPDVGGISEVITSDTGILVAHDADDEILIGNYVDAISTLARTDGPGHELVCNAQQLLRERHSREMHQQRVVSIFEMAD